MDYYANLQAEAAKTVEPLAVRARTLQKRRQIIEDRIRDTREDIDRKAAALDKHRSRAGDRLSKSSSAFSEWQGRLRRLTREHETAREALAFLESDLDPASARELSDARKEIRLALERIATAAKAACELKMGELLARVVEERDGFTDALGRICRDFGAATTAPGPVAASDRLGEVKRRIFGPRWVTFTDKPPVRAAAAAEAATAAPVRAEPERVPQKVAEVPQSASEGP